MVYEGLAEMRGFFVLPVKMGVAYAGKSML